MMRRFNIFLKHSLQSLSSSPIFEDASRRRLEPSPTCLTAARWFPRKWDVAVLMAKLSRAVPALAVKGGIYDSTNFYPRPQPYNTQNRSNHEKRLLSLAADPIRISFFSSPRERS